MSASTATLRTEADLEVAGQPSFLDEPLPTTRRDAWEWYWSLQASRWAPWHQMEAWLGRNDLFFLLVRLLRRPDIDRDWLFERCREVQANPDGYLDLWAREHYKSTIITFGQTIRDVLNNPEETVGILSHTRPIAKGFLAQIKREFEDNDYLKRLYPDVLWADPQKQSPRWSEDGGLIVKRQGNPKEATIEAHGLVDGQPTGKHYSLLVYDDVIASLLSPEMVTKTTDGWDLSQNLGTAHGRRRMIGTRYSLHDSYATILARGAAKPRIYPATHNGRFDGHPVLLTKQQWSDKLRDSSRTILAAQQLQNPMADESATFRPEWLRPYEVRPRTMNVYIACDPSRGRSATSDNTAIAVIGIGSGGAKFLLDGYCHRMTLSQRWTALKNLRAKWSRARGVQHISVGYERYGAQSDDEYFLEQMDLDRVKKVPDSHFAIEELNWPREGGNSKRERVERLEPDFRNGRFYLPLPLWREGRAQVWSLAPVCASCGGGPALPIPSKVDEYRCPKCEKSFIHHVGDVTYFDNQGLTKLQMQAIEGGSPDLVAKAIRNVDQDGRIYDLTMHFMEEFRTFPFGLLCDLVDATSRIYDMEARGPVATPAGALDPIEHWDR